MSPVGRPPYNAEALTSEMLQRTTPQKLVPLTEDTPIGTLVALVDDFHGLTITRTRTLPWRLGHGALVVSVVGRTGGYDAKRIHIVPIYIGGESAGWTHLP